MAGNFDDLELRLLFETGQAETAIDRINAKIASIGSQFAGGEAAASGELLENLALHIQQVGAALRASMAEAFVGVNEQINSQGILGFPGLAARVRNAPTQNEAFNQLPLVLSPDEMQRQQAQLRRGAQIAAQRAETDAAQLARAEEQAVIETQVTDALAARLGAVTEALAYENAFAASLQEQGGIAQQIIAAQAETAVLTRERNALLTKQIEELTLTQFLEAPGVAQRGIYNQLYGKTPLTESQQAQAYIGMASEDRAQLPGDLAAARQAELRVAQSSAAAIEQIEEERIAALQGTVDVEAQLTAEERSAQLRTLEALNVQAEAAAQTAQLWQEQAAQREATFAREAQLTFDEEAARARALYAVEQQAAEEQEAASVRAGTAGRSAGGGGLGIGLNSAKYIAGGLVVFGLIQQVREALKDSENLEKVLALTRVQMEALGESAQFEKLRSGIISIAAETGSLNSEVAQVAQQFQAAFGGDSVRALNETDAAMKAVKVTGLSIGQVTNDFLALDKSFESNKVSIEQVTDSAIGLQQRFGTLAKDSIEFAAQLAPIGAQTGFSAKDLEAIGAAYQEFSGRPASAGSEQIGRVLGGIQDKAVALVEFLQKNAPTIANSVAQAIASGDIRSAFVLMLGNYDKLTQGQQQQMLSTIAGRREAATLAAVFGHNAKLLDELNGKYDDSGKLQQTFTAVQKTLLQQLQELGAKVRDVGLDFYNSGLKEFLTTIGTEVGVVLEVFDKFATVLGTVDSATGGLASDLAALLFTLKAIEVVAGSNALIRLLGAAGVSSIGGTTLAAGAGGTSVLAATGLAGLLAKFNPITGVRAGVSAFGAARAGTAAVEGFGASGIGAEEAIAGGSLATSLGAGASAAITAAGPGLVLLGTALADKLVGSFSSGVQATIDTHIRADLGGKLTVDNIGDVNKVLAGRNIGGAGINDADSLIKFLTGANIGTGPGPSAGGQLEEALAASGKKKPTDALDDLINEESSAYQRLLDNLPGPTRSQSIDELRERVHKGETAIAASVKNSLDTLQSNGDLTIEFVKELNSSGSFAFGRGGGLGTGTTVESVQNQVEGLIQALDAVGGDPTKLSGDDQKQYFSLFKVFGEGGPLAKAQATVNKRLQDQADALAQQQVDIGDAATAKNDYAAGLISLNDYLSQLNAAQTALDSLAASGNPPNVKAAQKGRADLVKATSDALRQQADLTLDAADIGGTDSPQQKVSVLTNLLANASFTDRADRLKATKDLVSAIKAEKTYEASLTNDAIQKAAILSSTDALPADAQTELIAAFLNSSIAFQTYLANVLNINTDLQAGISLIVSTEIANGEKNIKVATGNAIRFEIATLQNVLKGLVAIRNLPFVHDQERIDKIAAEIASLTTTQILNAATPAPDVTVPDFSQVGEDAATKQAAAQAALNEQKAIVNANLDKLAAYDHDNAIALAKIAVERADKELAFAQQSGVQSDIAVAEAHVVEAQNGLTKAYADQRSALRSYNASIIQNNDPLGKAISEAGQAQDDLAQILDTQSTEYIKALQGKQEADRNVIKAFLDEADSYDSVTISEDNLRGDAVGAAQKKLQELQRRYKTLLESGTANPTDLNALQGQINDQTLQVAETQISQGERQIQTALDLRRINKSQAVAQLEALKVYAKNQQEIDQIDLEIKQLQGEIGQDFKFNIPSVLGLPTLYEARRLNQTSESGSGYQDNRVITNNVYINATGASAQQVASIVTDQLIGNARSTSTYPRRYGTG